MPLLCCFVGNYVHWLIQLIDEMDQQNKRLIPIMQTKGKVLISDVGQRVLKFDIEIDRELLPFIDMIGYFL